jgi:restriction endonuclease S subunit
LVGRFLYIDDLPSGKISFSGFTIRLRPLNDKINSKFLCHYLKTDIVRNKLIGNSKGSNIKNLNQTLLSSVKIPIPPLSEQQKIVSEIEEIESNITTLEKELSNLPKQKEAVLKQYL